MIALYAITDNPAPPLPDVDSLQGVSRGDLTAVCAPAEETDATPEVLWRHERVVEALMKDRDVLPVRYGTCVADEQAAGRALQANHDRLLEALNFVREAVEVSVRVLETDGQPVPAKPRSGAEYLRAKAGELAGLDDAARVVHEPLCALSRAQVLRHTSLPGEMLRAAYLIDQDQVERFSAEVARLQRANASWRLLCTGPWPPYSFASR